MNTTSINTPKAYEIIEHDGRHGIVFDKITGVDLLSEFLKNPTDENLAAEIIENLSRAPANCREICLSCRKNFCLQNPKMKFPTKVIFAILDLKKLTISLMGIISVMVICIRETLSEHQKTNFI